MLTTDKIDFKTDPLTGDLDLSGGRINLSSGLAGVGQAAFIAVSQIRSEWFLNLQKGLPLIEVPGVVSAGEALLGQKFDQVKFESAVRGILQAVPAVLQVSLLLISRDSRTRKLTSKWQLRTLFGDTPLTTVVH